MGISLKMQVLSCGVYETLLALTGILSFRSLLVPSRPAWTAFIGAMAAAPCTITVFGMSAQLAAPLVAPQTIRMIYIGRCLLALASDSRFALFGMPKRRCFVGSRARPQVRPEGRTEDESRETAEKRRIRRPKRGET